MNLCVEMNPELFSCDRCGFVATTKSNLKQHLFRKTICIPRLNSIPREELQKSLFASTDEMHQRKRFTCEYCAKGFTSSQAKYKHKRYTCKKKNLQSSLEADSVHEAVHEAVRDAVRNSDMDNMTYIKNQIQMLTDRLNTMEETKNGIIQENCQNTIQVNMINAFGREDTGHLTSQFLDRCVKKTNVGLIELLDKLHFGASDGCNANVRITNRKLPLAEVNDGQQWKFEKKDRVLNRMVDKGQDLLQEHLEEHQDRIKEQLSESMWEHIQTYFERMEVRDEATIQDILDDVYIMLLNKSRELSFKCAAR